MDDEMDQYSKPPVQIVDEQVRKIDRFSRVSKNLLKIKKEALFNKYVNNIYYKELDKFTKNKGAMKVNQRFGAASPNLQLNGNNTMFLDRKAFFRFTTLRGIADIRNKRRFQL